MNYTIEKMTGDDVRAVREIDSRSAALPWPLSSYEYEVRHNLAGRATVARSRDGLILGFLIAWLIVDEFHVANIAVDTPFRRLGIGYALMRQGLIAANKGYRCRSFQK